MILTSKKVSPVTPSLEDVWAELYAAEQAIKRARQALAAHGESET